MAATSRHATAAAGGSRPSKLPRMLVFAVVSAPSMSRSSSSSTVARLRQSSALGTRDEPEAAGALHAEPIELEAGTPN
jgi:hypothetical protein